MAVIEMDTMVSAQTQMHINQVDATRLRTALLDKQAELERLIRERAIYTQIEVAIHGGFAKMSRQCSKVAENS